MTNTVNSREIILDVLLSITRDGEFSHIILKQVLDKYSYLDKVERSFIKRVCQGTLENQIRIDYIINQVSSVPVKKMKSVIQTILRSGVYQLEYMDQVPDSAACNEAVKLTKKRKFQNLSGFVNGVLRSVIRNRENIEFPDKEKNPEEFLSITYSMPMWIVIQWVSDYGYSITEEMLQSFLIPSTTSIRCNLNHMSVAKLKEKLEGEGVTVEENPDLPFALQISKYDMLSHLPPFQEGDFYVQDVSSMRVALAGDPKPGDLVIDVCAAPGGKSLHIAELLGTTGMVEARDLTENKIELIQHNIDRIGQKNIKAVLMDATILDEDSVETADLLIADLPCSGLGVIGKKTDIKYNMSQEKIKEIVLLQRHILDVVSAYVKPGGTMIYSTCTIQKSENQENVEWFLTKHDEFELITQEQIRPKSGSNDGFYIAKLKKRKNNEKN